MWAKTNEFLKRGKKRVDLPFSLNDGIKNDNHIADCFNSHFTTICPKLAKTMPDTNSFEKYLPEYNGPKFVFDEITPYYIDKLIGTLDKKRVLALITSLIVWSYNYVTV